eukprot:GCRY01003657.1.p1 GENE.GCRY01003657.1~~GCRY01003657.1.p1  ORF type:complete len:355 (+),score=74.64 GCRY01003657.1:245-1309(+)
MFWADKYAPKDIKELDFHSQLIPIIKKLGSQTDLPHLLFYGPAGSGRKTRILTLLKEIYGNSVEKVKVEHRSFKTPSNSSFEISFISSTCHIEISPSDAGFHDRIVVQELIKEIAQSQQMFTEAVGNFKVIVLNEVERMSRQAQAALRRTMEKYSKTCRLILYCNSISKIIEPIRSRCFLIRVPAPTVAEVTGALQAVAAKEKFALPRALAERIAEATGGNMRRALFTLQACKTAVQGDPPEDMALPVLDYQNSINVIATRMLEEQSPAQLLFVRGKLYELLTHQIPADVIFTLLTESLLKKLDATLKHDVVLMAAQYEHMLLNGQKAIFYLEAFVAKVMSLYKKWSYEMFCGF